MAISSTSDVTIIQGILRCFEVVFWKLHFSDIFLEKSKRKSAKHDVL